MHWLNVYIRFTRERCNRSSVNKRFTWIVATFKKAAALGTKVGFCTRWLKFCSTKAIIFLSLPSNDLDELKNPIYFHLRSSRASILMKFCKSAKIVELQKKTFSRFSRSPLENGTAPKMTFRVIFTFSGKKSRPGKVLVLIWGPLNKPTDPLIRKSNVR